MILMISHHGDRKNSNKLTLLMSGEAHDLQQFGLLYFPTRWIYLPPSKMTLFIIQPDVPIFSSSKMTPIISQQDGSAAFISQ